MKLDFPSAPEMKGGNWLNGPAPTETKLKGRVRLVYFFSIGEPDSLAALPLLRYYHRVHRKHIAVIGVHVPKYEQDEEKDLVRRALKGLEIEFPVVLDNERKVWRAYRNQFWGQVQIVDGEGRIRHTHAGENVEEEVEQDAYYLLKESGSKAELRPRIGEIELEGDWTLEEEGTEHTSRVKDACILRYEGTSLAIAVKSPTKAVIEVRMDGKPVPEDSRDDDLVQKGNRTVLEVEGEQHLHVIREEIDMMHDVAFLVSTKGLQIISFFY